MPQSHTFANRCKPTQRPKFAKECGCPTQEEIHFFPPTLRCFNFFANAQPMTDKHFDSSERKQKVVHLDTEDRTPSANMGLASCGVTCLNSIAVFQINFSAWLTVLCPEIPHERQAQKR